MRSILYVVYTTISFCIDALCIMMIVRAVLSWFPGVGRNSRVMAFIYSVTEIFIAPVRNFMNRFDFIRRFPLDLSLLVTMILLEILQGFLYYGFALLYY